MAESDDDLKGESNFEDKNNEDKKNKRKRKNKYEEKGEFVKKTSINKYKHQNNIFESVIVNGVPFFVTFSPSENKLKVNEEIQIDENKSYIPSNLKNCFHLPYYFSNKVELDKYVEEAKGENIISLYRQVKEFVIKCNDQDTAAINIITIYTVLSYFFDKLPSVFYLLVTGDNDTGKTSIGKIFHSFGYRAVNMTDPTEAMLFRTYGKEEEGQVSLILDEYDRVDDNPAALNILKSGYDKGNTVPRFNSDTREPEFFRPYGPKILIGEKSLSLKNAKGVIDRSFSLVARKGRPLYSIKDILNAENESNNEFLDILKEMLHLRKKLLIYRILHHNDRFEDIIAQLDGRTKELARPVLQLFFTESFLPSVIDNKVIETLKEIVNTLQYFIDVRTAVKELSIENLLIPLIDILVKERGTKIKSSDVWTFVISNLPGKADEFKKDMIFNVDGYGPIYKNTLPKILIKIGARLSKGHNHNFLLFDSEKIKKSLNHYTKRPVIKICFREFTYIGNGAEVSDASEVFAEEPPSLLSYSKEIEERSNHDIEIDENIGQNDEQNYHLSKGKGEFKSSAVEINNPKAQKIPPLPPQAPQPIPIKEQMDVNENKEKGKGYYECYLNNCSFSTDNEIEYQKHTVGKRNSLCYPNLASIYRNGWQPQGKPWEL